VIVALALFGYDGWLIIRHHQEFYSMLFGADGLGGVGWLSLPTPGWLELFLTSSASYYVLVIAAATFVGLLIFGLLQMSSDVLYGSIEVIEAARDKDQSYRQERREVLYRLLLRLTALAGWTIYAMAFFSSLLPLYATINRIGLDDVRSHNYTGLAYCLAAGVLLMIIIHMHVIFLRLALLKPRVFGGVDEVIVAEAEHQNLV
jgi:hypothetical protein